MKCIVALLFFIFPLFGMKSPVENGTIFQFNKKIFRYTIDTMATTKDLRDILLLQVKVSLYCLQYINCADAYDTNLDFPSITNCSPIKDTMRSYFIGLFLTLMNSLLYSIDNIFLVEIFDSKDETKYNKSRYLCSITALIQLFLDDLGYSALRKIGKNKAEVSLRFLRKMLNDNTEKLYKLLNVLALFERQISISRKRLYCYLYAYLIYGLDLSFNGLSKKLIPIGLTDALPIFHCYQRFLSVEQQEIVTSIYSDLGLYDVIVIT